LPGNQYSLTVLWRQYSGSTNASIVSGTLRSATSGYTGLSNTGIQGQVNGLIVNNNNSFPFQQAYFLP